MIHFLVIELTIFCLIDLQFKILADKLFEKKGFSVFYNSFGCNVMEIQFDRCN